ncbi:multidrug/biocide efflux PACE transporter [Uliginosibacterium sp. sgz301328]|uniref:multidrug/biocide efflux PACE transporter n=1 Tax=Uliginosibacterium sp. sgz301328 TaxID=3243764 RepID=UPI00359E4C08
MSAPTKTLRERIFHAVCFEVGVLCVASPLFAWIMDVRVVDMGILTIAIGLIAMAWNMIFNALFERAESRFGLRRTLIVRICHAVLFELGLLLVAVPLAALWLNIGMVPAFLLEVGFALFMLPYTVIFNWLYDTLRAFVMQRPSRETS